MASGCAQNRVGADVKRWSVLALGLWVMTASACAQLEGPTPVVDVTPDATLSNDITHAAFSSVIEPVLTVPSGAVVEVLTHEATGGQIGVDSDDAALAAVDMSRVHALSGPIYVEGAEPGDVLAVELLDIDVGDWGWMAIVPNFGVLQDEFDGVVALKTYRLDDPSGVVEFAEGIEIPLAPFPGIMGVAPATAERLSTFPPRANGGNIDDPHLVEGVTAYFPVFAPGALFSIGDTHAVQGLGEVSGTAIEAPMRVVVRLSVLKDARPIPEPQYESDAYYATTGFGTTLDEAAQKATRYMVDYLEAERGLSRADAYRLCSAAGDLMIAQAVNEPHKLVTMHMPKSIFRE